MTGLSPSDRLDELRRVLLKPEALTEQIRPIIARVLSEQIENSREEIAQAIAPVMGQALRHAGQSQNSREEIVKAIAPVMGEIFRLAEENQNSREEIAQAIAPVIGEAFKSADKDSYSRDKIARAISPMVGEALRRIDQTKGLHDEIAMAITPAMVNEALRRIEQFESSRVEVDQKMNTVLRRMDQIESDRTKISRTVDQVFERIEEIERVQEEVTKALIPLKDQALGSDKAFGSREEMIEAIQPIIDRMVQQTVSKTIKRMTGTILIRQATTPRTLPQAQPSEPKSRRFVWIGIALILIVIFVTLGWWIWRAESEVAMQVTASSTAIYRNSIEITSESANADTVTTASNVSLATTATPNSRPAAVSTLIAALTATATLPPPATLETVPPPVQTRLAELTAVASASTTGEVSPYVEATAEPTSTPESTSTLTPTPSQTPTATSSPTSTVLLTANKEMPATRTLLLPVTGVVASSVYLRDMPNGNITTFLTEPDSEVIVLAQHGSWYKIVVNLTGQSEQVGWIQTQWVSLYSPLPEQLITPTTASQAD